MYYLLETEDFVKPEAFRTRLLTEDSDYEPSDFIIGRQLAAREGPPLEVELWQRTPGPGGFAELFLDSIPLFRDDFLAALREAGVSNLQEFPVILRSEDRTLEYTNYKAVNILGLVAAADMKKSEFTDVTGTGMIAVAFRQLVINEQAAQNLNMFRLAEAVASIVVHQRVKEFLDTKNFKYLHWRSLKG